MRHRIYFTALVLSLLSVMTACRQGAPIPNPLSALAPAHVPPPATGSYQIPDQYSNGQASRQTDTTTTKIAANDQVIGSGVAQSSFNDSAVSSNSRSIQWGNDLSSYRGAEAGTGTAPAPANFRGSQSQVELDGPPAPRTNNYPTTSALNWQSPSQ